MKRVVLLVFLLIFSSVFVFAEESDALIKETYKLEGLVEYDDNPIEVIYLDEEIEKQVGEDEFVLSCRLEVKYLNEKYNLQIEENKEYDTLAGVIIAHYDGIPAAGEVVEVDDLQIRVLRTTRSRIELARVKKIR